MTQQMNAEAVRKLATELSTAFEQRERNNGDKFTCLKDGSPQWMTEVIHKAHGDALPDDHIYRFCELAADAISETDDDADEDAIREAIQAIEPPPYTHDQMNWFATNWEYCDKAISDGLWQSTPSSTQRHTRQQYGQVTDLVAIGMQLHIQEVGYALLEALTERADELETEE